MGEMQASSLPAAASQRPASTICDQCGAALDSAGRCVNLARFGETFHPVLKPIEQQAGLVSELIALARAQASRAILERMDQRCRPYYRCCECLCESIGGRIPHISSCRTGRILGVIDRICAATQTNLNEKEEEPTVERGRAEERVPSPDQDGDELSLIAAERVLACVRFCAGIPTEELQRQLPLASNQRRRWEEVKHLYNALPWLKAVEL